MVTLTIQKDKVAYVIKSWFDTEQFTTSERTLSGLSVEDNLSSNLVKGVFCVSYSSSLDNFQKTIALNFALSY